MNELLKEEDFPRLKQKILYELGVDITNEDGSYKTTETVLREIAEHM